jgi:O-antigen ligase
MTVEKTEGKSNLHHPQWLGHVLVAAATMFLSSLFFSIAVNSLSLGLMALAWLGIMLVQRKNLIISAPLDWFFLAYVAAELLSTVFSVRPEQSLLFSKRLLLIAVVYFFASMTTSEKRARWYITVLLGSAAIVALIGVLKLIFADPETTRRLGIFQFYMTTSELMMMAALLVVPFIIHPKTPGNVRWGAFIGLLPIMISLYATVTRGAYLATAAGLLFIAFVRNRKLLVPFLVVVVLFAVFAPPYVQDRLKSIVDLAHPENASRLTLWSAGLKIFADHPIVGVGDIDLHELFVQYSPPGSELPWGHLHNVLLQLLVTLGTVGFLAVVAMFVRIFVVEWRIYKKVRDDWLTGSFVLGALAVFVGFQINGLTEWSFGDQEVVLLFWTTLGLTLALGKLAERRDVTTVLT